MIFSNVFGTHSKKFLTLFTPLYWFAVLVAYFLLTRDWAIVRATSTTQEHLFGLFSFCIFFVFGFIAYNDYQSLQRKSLHNLLYIGLPILVSVLFLVNVAEHGQKSWDYNNYENTFRDVLLGENPYQSKHSLYPPIFAESMLLVYRAGNLLLPALGEVPKESALWMFVFYVHESALLYFLLLSYWLSMIFAERIGIRPLRGMLLVSGLFVFNVPILRTIIYNQINFYVVASILITLVTLTPRPFFSGIAVAWGGLIKIYPFVLIAPLLAGRKWKALAGVFVGMVSIIAIQTGGFHDLVLWKQFVRFYLSFPVERESSWFRSSSIMSFMRNSLDFAGAPPVILIYVFGIVFLFILGWIGLRFIQREKLYAPSTKAEFTLTADSDSLRDIGHLIDFSTLSLLLSPSDWEHHYVLAIPLAIWAFALSGRKAPWLLTTGLIFVFLLPTFNVYPFSYLRMAGVIILLVLTTPDKSNAQAGYSKPISQ